MPNPRNQRVPTPCGCAICQMCTDSCYQNPDNFSVTEPLSMSRKMAASSKQRVPSYCCPPECYEQFTQIHEARTSVLLFTQRFLFTALYLAITFICGLSLVRLTFCLHSCRSLFALCTFHTSASCLLPTYCFPVADVLLYSLRCRKEAGALSPFKRFCGDPRWQFVQGAQLASHAVREASHGRGKSHWPASAGSLVQDMSIHMSLAVNFNSQAFLFRAYCSRSTVPSWT